MKFSSLKESLMAHEIGDIERIENKQRINLSSHAYNILIHDTDIFEPKSAKQGEICSALINQIFENFRSHAESSVAVACQDHRSRLMDTLSAIEDLVSKQQAIDLLLKVYQADLEEKCQKRCVRKEHALMFRISKRNLDYLLSDEGQRESMHHHDNIGVYFKALLEEYCELPYVERERIYYKQFVDEIGLAILHSNMLKIVTRKKNTSYMKPLELGQDPEQLYNYLVGLMATSTDGPWNIASIRLSSITSCERRAKSAFISTETEKEVRSAIKKVGIQYLVDTDPDQKIVVEFTPEGEKMYRSILHLRPQYINKSGSVYEFSCSERQADNYFFKFGHNVRVLEPERLAAKFQRKYENAAKKYK